MDFISKQLQDYLEQHTQKESDLLNEVNRYTHLNVLKPRMLSGHFQGRVLSMLSHMISPKLILEIGTYTGYSALCLAEGLVEDGKLITIDNNIELRQPVQEFINKSPFSEKIEVITGDALSEIEQLNLTNIDLVFIDADKVNYLNYYKLVIDSVRKGGYIIADNVLWSGKVLEKVKQNDKATHSILEFNRYVADDNKVESVLLPIRDGLMVLRKK